MIASRLLHYDILEKVGEGGMGVVYKAHDQHLDRLVAIKLLPPERLADPSRKARFIQEARAASALNHPNIIVVHDIASDDGTDFMVMEFVPGVTLDQLIPKRGMPLPQALHIAEQMAGALACAHSAGIVHRDFKPSNVIVDEHGQVKVLDFGLAKLTDVKPSDEASTQEIGAKTDEGAIVGTVAYMSPEQAEGKPVDTRSDVFSFGAVLYEMISGHRAFQGDSNMSILASVINSPPQALSNAPPELKRIISLCLRKNPERRYQHMDDVRVAIEEFREELESGAALPETAPPRRPLWMWAAGAIILAMAAGLWLYSRAAPGAAGLPSSALPLTTYRGDESFPCFSPDGSQIAFVWTGERQDNADIYVKSIGADRPLRLTTDPRPELSPAWSPDGRYIAYLRQLEPLRVACYLIPPTGGAERKIGELSGQVSVIFRGLAWLPDSRRLLVGVMASPSWHSTGVQGLRLISTESEAQETWTRPEGGRGQDVSPSVSPDGRHVAFARVLDFDQSQLFVMDVPAPGALPSAPKRVAVNQPGAADPLWTRDGRELIYTAGFSGQPSFWRAPLSRPGAAEPVHLAGTNVVQPAVSATAGRFAYATSFLARPDVWRITLAAPGVAAGPPEMLLGSTQMDQNPTYSPDGTLIAFESSRSGPAEIWIADKDGRNPLQITSLGTRPNSPVWSPDGRQIAFRCAVEHVDQVCVASTLGGSVRMLTHYPAQNRPNGWSADGKWIYFNSSRSGRPQMWRVPAGGGETQFVTDSTSGRMSADGSTRFGVDTATNCVMAEPVGGGPSQKLVGPLSTMGNWALSRDGIYFIPRASEAGYRLLYYDFHSKTTREVVHLAAAPGWGVAVSPDGRSVLFTLTENSEGGSDLMLLENFR